MNCNDDENNKEKSKILGLNRNIFFTGLTSFFTDTSVKMLYPVLPVFLTSILGSSVTSVSIIEGVAESTSSVLKALSGWWSDKIGKNKPFMIFGYLMTALITPIFGFVSSWYHVLALRFMERVGKGVRTAPRDSIIAASGGKKSHGKNFGFHKAMDNSGAIIGPLLSYIILQSAISRHGTLNINDYRFLFLVATIPAVIGVITICLFIKEVKAQSESLGKITFSDFQKNYYAFLIIAFVFTMGNSTDTLLLLRAKDSGFVDAVIPLVYLVFNTSSVVFAVPCGILSDRIGRERIIIFGYLLYAAVYFGFALFESKILVILLMGVYGLYSAATDGIQKALVADLIGTKNRGTGLGLYNSIIGITLLPASVIGGVLWNSYSHSAPFIFGAVMALISVVMLLVFYRRRVADGRITRAF